GRLPRHGRHAPRLPGTDRVRTGDGGHVHELLEGVDRLGRQRSGEAVRMSAVRYHGTRDVRVDDIAPPDVRPGTVKVAPEWCGICGSDVHEYLAGPETIPAVGNPHPITGEVLPIVLGHEFAGRVVEVGAGVDGVAV